MAIRNCGTRDYRYDLSEITGKGKAMHKKYKLIALGVALVAVPAVIFLAHPGLRAAIVNTRHDFSQAQYNAWGSGEICKPCHTPHNAFLNVADSPLWAHNVTTYSSYNLYSSSTLNATMGQPNNQSKLCLSCHDGTVALGAYIGGPGGSTYMNSYANALIGTDLRDDHPISFTYNTALATADGELRDPSGNATVANLLFNSRMECASCHDPHGVAGVNKLLRMSNSGSALCLTCHVK
jgi:predicted CXXCH cytochrome family protein